MNIILAFTKKQYRRTKKYLKKPSTKRKIRRFARNISSSAQSFSRNMSRSMNSRRSYGGMGGFRPPQF